MSKMIVTLVGDPGGGKSTLAAVLGLIVKELRPDMTQVANMTAPSAQKVDDAHKFLATKLIRQDKKDVFVIDDEAAQAGLESRGSGSKGAAIESRIITHSRKAHAYLILISQLKSMIDKRAQWVEDVSILCEDVFEEWNDSELPDYFHYTVYNEKLEVLDEFDLESADMLRWVWPYMDSDDIPFFEAFKKQFISYYGIGPEDIRQFEKTMGYEVEEAPEVVAPTTLTWHCKKALKMPSDNSQGETILLDGKHWQIESRDWDSEAGDYRYVLSEIS